MQPSVDGVPDQKTDIEWRDLHTRLCEKFESSEESSRTNRQKAERDIDYYDGKQWTDEEVKELRKRGQPAHTDNRIKRKIRYLQGLEQSQRTDPRALPRTPKHEDDASSVTDALRSVTETNRYDQIRSKTWKDILSAGWGGVEVVAEPKEGAPNPQVVIRRCAWDRMFWDPHSCEDDFSDAGYLGLVLWMEKDEALRRYGPQAEGVFNETTAGAAITGSFDDKPRTWVHYNKSSYRIRVVQMYFLHDDGTWWFAEFTKGGYLQCAPSPWLDDEGKPEHPYSWRSANVDRDNNRYGEIRDMIDLQDGVNKRKSKLLHLVNVRQTFGTETALSTLTERELQTRLARPDGHVPLAHGTEFGKDFGIIPTSDLAEGQALLLQHDMAALDLQGPNAAMQGKDPRSQSGRAILAQQQGGALEANPVADTLRDMDHEAYRKVWRRIRQFWTAEEWVRVTDEERNLRWVGINAPAMQQVQDPMTGQMVEVPQIDPMTGQPVLQNQVAELDIDIIIDDAPHVGTMQQEEFAALADMAAKGFPISPKTLIKASSFRSKAEMLKEMDEAEKAQANQPPPEVAKMQAQMQLEQEKAKGQLALEQEKAQVQFQIKAMEAQAAREDREIERQQELAFNAAKHAQDMQFALEKFQLEQAARANAARDASERAKAAPTRQ